jgi:hypothetical protein
MGILIERFSVTGDRAFRVLARGPSCSNRHLVDVAADLG